MWCAVLAVAAAVGAAAPGKEPDRVGRIIVEGNTDTPDGVILRHLDLHPGQVLDYARLAAYRDRLRGAWLFDPAAPPAVEVLPNEFDGRFKDIRVRVTERPWNWAVFAARDGLVGLGALDPDLLWRAAERVAAKIRAWL